MKKFIPILLVLTIAISWSFAQGTKKRSSYTVTTNVQPEDLIMISVADETAATGFKTRNVQVSDLLFGLGGESGIITNINITTNLVESNSYTFTIATNLLEDTSNGGQMFVGETNSLPGVHWWHGTTNQSIAAKNGGIELNVWTNVPAMRLGRTVITNFIPVRFKSQASFEGGINVLNSQQAIIFNPSTWVGGELQARQDVGPEGGFRFTNTVDEVLSDFEAKDVFVNSATIKTVSLLSGAGSPESVVTAPRGSLYLRTDGAATTTLYVKTSGTGNTGWTAK